MLTRIDLEGFMTKTMSGWEETAYGEGLTRTWTGAMAYTIDRLPLIGPIPEIPDVYISAAYNVSLPCYCSYNTLRSHADVPRATV
jgi:hypothetical protein